MDTQGAFDPTMNKAQSSTIFGLTALLSSKIVYNQQNKIEDDRLDNLDYITTFVQTVCNELPRGTAAFGHLHMLIRDWVHYEDGYTLDMCMEQAQSHLHEHLSPEALDKVDKVERLKSCFRSMDVFALPHPGLKVTQPKFDGHVRVIDHDFIQLTGDFANVLFGKDFPQPSSPLGCEISVDGFTQIVTNFADAFKQSAQSMAVGLREAFVKVEMMRTRDELLKKFRSQITVSYPDTSVYVPDVLEGDITNIRNTYSGTFKTKLQPWRLSKSTEMEVLQELEKSINEVVVARLASNAEQVEGATMKLVASPAVACGAFFLISHPCVLCIGAAAGVYAHLAKWSKRRNTSICGPGVFSGVAQDYKAFFIQRWRDAQGIHVAIKRCNPAGTANAIYKVSKVVGGAVVVATGAISTKTKSWHAKSS